MFYKAREKAISIFDDYKVYLKLNMNQNMEKVSKY